MTPGLAGSGELELNWRSSNDTSPESAVVPQLSGLNEVVRCRFGLHVATEF